MKCQYRFCEAELPDGLNGNSRYCDYSCYYNEKKERSRETYAKRNETLTEIRRVESLLRICHQEFRDKPFNAEVLTAKNMNWQVITSSVTIDGKSYRVVGKYAYILFDNNTLLIIKLN